MVIRLIRYLRGYVQLLLNGQFVERFINICMHRGILLWDMRRGKDGTRLHMSLRAFKALPPIARKTHTRVRILKKCGLPVRLAAYNRRVLFLVGLLLTVVFLYGSSLFLWSVELEATERTDRAQLLQVLAELGVRPGAYTRGIDVREVKENVLQRVDTLSWIWVNIRGCRARVRVMEKTPAPQIVPTDACDIVAASDGIVSALLVTEGQARCAVGDTVRKGQVLISSVFTSTRENVPARFTHAAGEVHARTWYEKSVTLPLTETKKRFTGKTHTHRALLLGDFTLPLSDQARIPFQCCDRTQSTHSLVLFGFDTGIAYRTEVFCEYVPETVKRTPDAVIADAKKQLEAQIAAMRYDKNAVRTAVQTTHHANPDGTITVTLTAEYNEQIGTEQPADEL